MDCAQNFNNHGCKGYVPSGPEAPSTTASTGPRMCQALPWVGGGHLMVPQPQLGRAVIHKMPSAMGTQPTCSAGQAAPVHASCRGLPSQAFEYIRYNKGIMGEATYPYEGKVIGRDQLPPRHPRSPRTSPLPRLSRLHHSGASPAPSWPCLPRPLPWVL